MQKAETSLIPDQNPKDKPVLSKLMDIAIDEKNMVYINWPTDKKDICITALCESLKLVCTYQPPVIIKPKPSMMDFVKGIKR